MKRNTMSRSGKLAGILTAAALALGFLACSSGPRGTQPGAQGQHPATWLQTHWIAFNQNQSSCVPCHGSFSDPSSTGGTSGINCFTCHAQQQPPVNAPLHPAGYQTVGNTPFHGTIAKLLPSLYGGFSHCAQCHGSTYGQPIGAAASCTACHTKAPHPDAPWHGTTASGTNHASTDPANAAECAKCHLNGANLKSPLLRSTAPAGSAPGCFNNTLCHDSNPGHIADWRLAANHGVKGVMSPADGLSSCQACHGTTYNNGAAPSCFACHTNGAPHPAKPWSTKPALTHAVTNPGNAAACYVCHAAGANSDMKPSSTPPAGTPPGCTNNTMCHDDHPASI
jgi:hypothetical protein